jgi:hypothetical protein
VTCWGCTKHAETGLDGFVQADCPECMKREHVASVARHVELMREARRLANSENGRKWETKGADLTKDMRQVCPDEGEFRRLRRLVWAILKPSGG